MIRFDGVDRLRGLAIVLMVIDHVLVVAGSENHWSRHTVTRAALPLFCIIAGSLASKPSKLGRVFDLVVVGLLSAGLNVGVGQPDITLLFALGFALYRFWLSPLFIAICIIQPMTWPVPWGGYQPGTVCALLALGRGLVEVGYLNQFGARFWPFLGHVGRWPLSVYAAHLVAIAIWQSCH